MFTGLIETTGRVAELRPGSGSSRIAIRSDLPLDEVSIGESIAVDGVCLTVTETAGDRFRAVVVAETLLRTTLGKLRTGATVNLERALRVGDRLGGHLVQGHVDGVGTVASFRGQGDDRRLRVTLAQDLLRFVAHKGSITLQGVSLTVAGLFENGFEVALIPETLSRTTLGSAKAGDRLNVEVDLVARYLERLSDRSS